MGEITDYRRSVSGAFEIAGDLVDIRPYGNGHINDTYLSEFVSEGSRMRYIHQRINDTVFSDPEALMGNIRTVTEHQRSALSHLPAADAVRRALSLVPGIDGQHYFVDEDGRYWRTYHFIEGATAHDLIETPEQAFEAAKAFGLFQRQLENLNPERLSETIVDFHHTPKRLQALADAVAADSCGRVSLSEPEIEFALSRKSLTDAISPHLGSSDLPLRVTHNDTKLNNVMLDDETGEGICVIDLDTVMPGTVLWDFGDMVRTATATAAEDERDLSKVGADMQYFEAIANGYLAACGDWLTGFERELLPLSGLIITLETGIRFLTDFLNGDVYFRTHRDGHNLDRCRTQFALVCSLEQKLPLMRELISGVDKAARQTGVH